MRKTILIILGLVLVSGWMLAQGTTAALTGTVTSDGKPLAGVAVTVSSPSLQGTRTTVTGANGVYNFSALPPGEYTIAYELPPHRVTAVVHAPGGAHPSPVQGYYGRDHAAFGEYHEATRERQGFVSWLQEWVLDVANRDAYLSKLGPRFAALRPTHQLLAAPVDYA